MLAWLRRLFGPRLEVRDTPSGGRLVHTTWLSRLLRRPPVEVNRHRKPGADHD